MLSILYVYILCMLVHDLRGDVVLVHAECVLTVCVYAVLVRMCSLLYISVLYAVYRVFVLVSQTGELRCVLAGYTRQSYTLLQL